MSKKGESIGPAKQKREYYYSIAVMAVIPLLIVANTLVLIRSVREDYDLELRRKADVANKVLASSIGKSLDDQDFVQSVVEQIIEENEEVLQLSVVVPVEGTSGIAQEYQVLASSDQEVIDQPAEGLLLTTIVQQNQSVATEQVIRDGTKTWAVGTIISDGEDINGIVVVNFGFDRVNALVASVFNQSLFILMGVVAVVFLLLLNHFKFVNYSVLFKKLKEVDQLKNDFLSVATHELKSPMAVIKGSLENINDGVFGQPNDQMRETLNLALSETDRLANLVTDLLNVSRIEQGRVTYKDEPVNMQEILLHLTNQYRSKAQAKGLTLSYDATEMNYIITADHGRILEIFTNLIDNAIKYSEKGEITVFHQIDKNIVTTTVRDTGIGMSAKERENLFSRFYRIQNEKTAKIAGTGLGLWIIKQYIEAMKGHIYVDSLEGVGTSFTVEFPLTASKPAPGFPGNPTATETDSTPSA